MVPSGQRSASRCDVAAVCSTMRCAARGLLNFSRRSRRIKLSRLWRARACLWWRWSSCRWAFTLRIARRRQAGPGSRCDSCRASCRVEAHVAAAGHSGYGTLSEWVLWARSTVLVRAIAREPAHPPSASPRLSCPVRRELRVWGAGEGRRGAFCVGISSGVWQLGRPVCG